jgi:phosphoribosylamine--glycine ligase
MNSRNGHRQDEETIPVLKYVGWFLVGFIVAAVLAGLLQAVLPKWKALQLVMGILIVHVGAEFARRRFEATEGRALIAGERWRLLLGSAAVIAMVTTLAMMLLIQGYNDRLFTIKKIPTSMALVVGLAGLVVYAPVLWFSYWWKNSRSGLAAYVADARMPVPKVKVLVIGGGGREHALAWKLAQSSRVMEVIVAPGNAGTAHEAKCRNAEVAVNDLDGLLALAQRENVAVTVVGPEIPLVAGVVDLFRASGLRIFGPTAAAAQLEGSKAYAKDFLARHGIPTAFYSVFTEVEPALAYVREKGAPIVVKADGLAAGKGVIVAMTLQEAEDAVTDMLSGNAFGDAGARVVIEEFLDGEEASFISMVDGKTALPMATSQDHKRVGDGDTGPNTGGMGAYSPAPVVTLDVHARVMREVVNPTVKGMIADGIPFTGFLYAGLMIDASGAPKVIEFNVRFGDPETQPVMLRLQSDLLQLVDAAIDGELHDAMARWNPRPALGVVMAAANYPESPRVGDVIQGLGDAQAMGTKVFHAGTRIEPGKGVVTSGGRVLCVTALGDNVRDAQRNAYEGISHIQWHGEFHRHDIGWRAIEREQGTTL